MSDCTPRYWRCPACPATCPTSMRLDLHIVRFHWREMIREWRVVLLSWVAR